MNTSSRGYDSPGRDRQAQETRRAILAAASELFVAQGYAATSVAAIARRAEVTAQTVYNSVGTKQQVLRAAYDVAIVGDDEPVPLAQRADVVAMYAATDPETLVRGYAGLSRRTAERIGPLARQIAAGAATGEAELVAWQQVTDQQRLAGVSMLVERVAGLRGLRPGLSLERARDQVWTLNSVEVWHLLTGVRGWGGDAYEQFLGDALVAAILA